MYDLFIDFALTQCVTEPTRYSSDGNSSSVLDLYATTRPDVIQQIEVTDPISDHCGVHVNLDICPANYPKSRVSVHKFFDYKHADWDGLRTALLKTPFLPLMMGSTNVNTAWKVWENLFIEQIRQFVPERVKAIRGKHRSWMTSSLYRLCRQKRRLFRIAVRRCSDYDWAKYKQCRNRCTEELRTARSSYLSEKHRQIVEEEDGSHRWWALAKRLCGITQAKQPMANLEDNGVILSSALDKANLLARFFSRQCGGDSENEDFINAPFPLPETHATFDFPPISEQTVLKCLLRLSPSKSTADVSYSNRILRECAPIITPSLAYLFNLSVASSSFPEAWKEATVIPLYKNRGSTASPTNYRPVSLLPSIGKVLDSIQSRRLLQYPVRHNLINPHQFGFLPGRSTVLQLVYIVETWVRARDQGKSVGTIFLDFMKAFDKVWHHGLIHKLQACGLSQTSIEWLRSYLSDRSIRVRVDSDLSSSQLVKTGVPQGSHLGPVLFLVFINELPTVVNMPTELYADDALIHNIFHKKIDQSVVESTLQPALSAAEDWALSWRGNFGQPKTKFLFFNGANSKGYNPSNHSLSIEGVKIDLVKCHKHLGITISSTLEWHTHISDVIRVGKQRAGLLRWMCRDLPQAVAVKLYLSYVRPVLEYGSAVWHSGLREIDALAIERVQASVARTILRASRDRTKSSLFAELNWPSLRWRREIGCLCLLHQLLYTRTSPFTDILFPLSALNHAYNTRTPLNLILPPLHTTRYMNSFLTRASILWNSLPHELQNIKDKKSFKLALSLHWQSLSYQTSDSFAHLIRPV